MGITSVSLRVNEEEYASWKEDAKEKDIPVSTHLIKLIRSGDLLWDIDDFDPELLIEDKENETRTTQKPTLNADIASQILKNLPDNTHDSGIEKEELRELIFGAKEEQLERIDESLNELYNQEKVEAAFKGGYVKKDD